MDRWKFVLVGVTGDLAKKKIIPSFIEFTKIQTTAILLRFWGYSRSVPDQTVIDFFKPSRLSENIQEVVFRQGSYDSADFWTNLTSDLQVEEKLVVYLATPPSTFPAVLKNFVAVKELPIHILMEKPFATNHQEALEIAQLITHNSLVNQVHLVDHYLFKQSLSLSRADLSNFQFLKDCPIKQIEIKALEALGAEGRTGYYAQTGAVLDMLPSHLLTLLRATLKLISRPTQVSKLKLKNILTGQYKSYSMDLGQDQSTTNTYFELEAELPNVCSDIKLVSGKKLGRKDTSITITFATPTNQLGRLHWAIDPAKQLQLEYGSNSLNLNLDRHQLSDHANLFNALLDCDFSKFLSIDEMLEGWQIYEQVVTQLKNQKPMIYLDGFYPIQPVE